MPRPPVRPEDRKRSTRACIACRATKKRCDAAQPCRPCVYRGVGASCSYSQHIGNRRATRQPRTQSQALNSIGPETLDTERRHRASLLPQFEESSSQGRDGATSSVASRKSSTSSGPRPVMMYTLSGEKVYVGNASAIAFLQYLRGSLRILGPDFTVNQGCHRMFEAQVPVPPSGDFTDDIDDAERKALVQRFLDASSGLLDIFDESEMDRLLAFAESQNRELGRCLVPNKDEGLLCLYMMIAIGAQCRGQPGDALKAYRYFEEARKLSFTGMLSDPTLNTARGFILMAFYMFGACRRNSAFMYLGVATKAASVMGLHMVEQFRSLSENERSLRSRIDKSIRLFDVICSSILGRPTSIAPCKPKGSQKPQDDRHRTQAVDAACTLATTLNKIVDALAEDSQLGIVRAEQFLDDIKDWSKSLPSLLRQRPKATAKHSGHSQSRETAIGNIHVACTYYFGIILTTREFLIQDVMSQLDSKKPFADICQEHAPPENKKRVSELSNACVDAAVFMSETCSEALDSRTIMGNMCILKAWLFTAGLILGFSLLVPDVPRARGRAFHNSLRVLDFLGHLSPQAAQYHRLLLSFSQAIDSFKSHSPAEHSQRRAAYVERILSLNQADNPDTTESDAVPEQTYRACSHHNNDSLPAGESNIGNLFDPQLAFDSVGRGGEDLILSLLWDGETAPFTGKLDFLDAPEAL